MRRFFVFLAGYSSEKFKDELMDKVKDSSAACQLNKEFLDESEILDEENENGQHCHFPEILIHSFAFYSVPHFKKTDHFAPSDPVQCLVSAAILSQVKCMLFYKNRWLNVRTNLSQRVE